MNYTQSFFFWSGFSLVLVVGFIIVMYTSLELKTILVIGVVMICSIVAALMQAPFALREQNKKD